MEPPIESSRMNVWIGKDRALSWTIAVSILLINFITIGLGRMSSLLYVDFIREFRVNRKYAAAPFSVQQSTRNIFGPVVGLLGHRFGVRAVTIAGGLIGAVSGTVSAYAKDMLWITVFWGALYGIGIAFTSTLGQIILDEYFEKYLSSASGLSFSGGSLGTFIFSFVLQKTIDLYGLSNTFIIMGVMTLFVIPLAMTLVKPPPWVTPEEERRLFWPSDHFKGQQSLDKQFGRKKESTAIEGTATVQLESEKSGNIVATKSIDKTGSRMTSPFETTFSNFSKDNTRMDDKVSQNAAEKIPKITVEGERLGRDSTVDSNETLCSNISEDSIYHQALDGSSLSGEKTEDISVEITGDDLLDDKTSQQMSEAEKFIEKGEIDTSFALPTSVKDSSEKTIQKTVSQLERKLESLSDAKREASLSTENSEKQPFIVEKYILKKVTELKPDMVVTTNTDRILKQAEVIQNMDRSQEKSDEAQKESKEIFQTKHPVGNSEDELTFSSPMPSSEAVKKFAEKKFLKKKIAGLDSLTMSGEANCDENKGAKPKVPSAKKSLGKNKKKKYRKYPRPIIENPSIDTRFIHPPPEQVTKLDNRLDKSPERSPGDDDLLGTNKRDNYDSITDNQSTIHSFNINFMRRHMHDIILVLNMKRVVSSKGTFQYNYGSIWFKDREIFKELEELFISIEREKSKGFDCEERKSFWRKSSLYPRLQAIFRESDQFILSHFEDERFVKLVCELRALYDYVKEPPTLTNQDTSLQQPTCWPPFMQVIFRLYLNPAYLVICLSRAVHLMTFMGVLTFIVDFALDRGLKETDARYSVTMMSLGDLIGRLCTGWITDTKLISLERYMLLAMVFIGVISISLPYLPTNILLPFVCLYSILQGSLFIRHPVLVSKYTRPQERTVGMGFMTLFSGLLGLLMPFYIGYYRDEIGTYNHIFFINGGICIGIGLLWMLEPRLKKYAA